LAYKTKENKRKLTLDKNPTNLISVMQMTSNLHLSEQLRPLCRHLIMRVPLDVPPAGRSDVRPSPHYVLALWFQDKKHDVLQNNMSVPALLSFTIILYCPTLPYLHLHSLS